MKKMKLFTTCAACGGTNLYKFIDFGPMPKPNIYLTQKSVRECGQVTYQLDASMCKDCGLVQLGQIVPSEDLFAANYAYRTPEAMREDFAEAARETIERAALSPGSNVLEVGGGIGIALEEYKKLGMNVLNVDPATSCAREAKKRGVETIVRPFTLEVSKEIEATHGKMAVVTAANVMQHIPNLTGTFAAIANILAPTGVFVLEFPYLGDILTDLAFDTFYAEHYFYLSLHPLQKIFESLDMTMVHAKKLPNIHCGSMRIFAMHNPLKENLMSVELQELIKEEEARGFLNTEMYDQFRKRIDDNMHSIQEHLYIAKMRGDKIVAHGASAKFITLTNYGHLSPSLIDYVADNTVYKQGKFTPGMGIPVVSEEQMIDDAPDVVLCGIRNFYQNAIPLYDKIRKKNPKMKVMIPIPEVKYV